MATTQNTQQDLDNGFLLEGTVHLRNRRIAGSERLSVGNTTAFKLKANSEKKERTSRQKGTSGNALDTVTIKKPTEISFSVDTFNKLTLAMALMGQSAVLDENAKTITDEVVNLTSKGVWLELANRNIDPTTISIKHATSNAKIKSEYIQYNQTLGWIWIDESADNINAGDDMKISYKTLAGGGLSVGAETVADYDFEMWFDGFNHASQKNFVLHIPSAVVSSESELDWLADDFNSAEFSGNLVLVSGHKSPYYYQEFNGNGA